MLGVEVEFKRSKYLKLFPAELRRDPYHMLGERDKQMSQSVSPKMVYGIQNTPKLSPRCRIQLKNIRYQLKTHINVKGQILNFYNFSDETKRMSFASSKFMIKTISYTTCPKRQKKRQVTQIANLSAFLKNCPESRTSFVFELQGVMIFSF